MSESVDRSLQPYESVSDEDLAKICASRPPNEEVWGVFYSRFYILVHKLIRWRLAAQPNEIDDVVQDAFFKIFRELPSFDPSKSKLKTYISQIVMSVVIDNLRHGSQLRSRSFSLEGDLGVLQLQARLDPEILRRAAERLVDTLGDKSKMPLIRDVLSGKDVLEICKKHSVTQYEVYKARNWLRSQLREITAMLPEF
jgi:RNA polymerase sigma factor (sigma-70 family)